MESCVSDYFNMVLTYVHTHCSPSKHLCTFNFCWLRNRGKLLPVKNLHHIKHPNSYMPYKYFRYTVLIYPYYLLLVWYLCTYIYLITSLYCFYQAYFYWYCSCVYKTDAHKNIYKLGSELCNHVYLTHDGCVFPFSISKYIHC